MEAKITAIVVSSIVLLIGQNKRISVRKNGSVAGIDIRTDTTLDCTLSSAANRGGSHHDTRPTLQYTGEHDETTEGTPKFAARSQHYTALDDSLTQCRFVSEGGWDKRINDRYRDAINLATGWDLTTEEVEEIGERVYNLERIINVERGVASRETDTLPYRVLHEPIPDGPAEGMYCPPEEFRMMLEEYYAFRGWDQEDGTPTRETIERLDLVDVI